MRFVHLSGTKPWRFAPLFMLFAFFFAVPARGAGTDDSDRATIVLVTIDGARADLPAQADDVPALASLAREGAWLTGCTTPTPLTFPATVSLLSGCAPERNRVHDEYANPLPDDVQTLATIFSAAGWDTQAFPADYLCHSLSGLSRGFTGFHQDSPAFSDSARTDSVLVRLRGERPRPLLVWLGLSLLPPREPWERFRGCGASTRAGYLESAWSADIQIARLREELTRSGARRTLLVVCGTHGQNVPGWPLPGAPDENRVLPGNGLDLSESGLRVPLIFLGGGIPSTARGSLEFPDGWVSTLDLLPTLAEWAGLRVPEGIDGNSLLSYLNGGTAPARPLTHELFTARTLGWGPRLALRQGDWKVMRYGDRWGFERIRSGKEAGPGRPELARISGALAQVFTVPPPAVASIAPVTDSLFDPEMEQMRSLFRAREIAADEGGRKASEWLQQLVRRYPENCALQTELAMSEVFQRQERNAAFLLDSLRTRHPEYIEAEAAYAEHLLAFRRDEVAVQRLSSLSGHPMFESDRLWRLGAVLLVAGKSIEAEATLNRAAQVGSPCLPLLLRFRKLAPEIRSLRAEVTAFPGRSEPHLELGKRLGELELYDDAYREIHQTRGLDPTNAEADYWLGYFLLEEGRGRHAAAALERAIEKAPLNVRYQASLGYAYILEKDEAKALAMLDGAIAMGLKDPLAYYNVACLLARSGRLPEALDRLEEAVRLGYSNRSALLNDADLNPLREQPRFQAIIKGLR